MFFRQIAIAALFFYFGGMLVGRCEASLGDSSGHVSIEKDSSVASVLSSFESIENLLNQDHQSGHEDHCSIHSVVMIQESPSCSPTGIVLPSNLAFTTSQFSFSQRDFFRPPRA